MSLPAARQKDLCTGHGCYPPRPAADGSPTVFTNKRAQQRIGDNWLEHCCGDNCHDAKTTTGSGTVFIDGKPAARITDAISCGSVIMTGSHNVYIGG